jgi:hypothetical protein
MLDAIEMAEVTARQRKVSYEQEIFLDGDAVDGIRWLKRNLDLYQSDIYEGYPLPEGTVVVIRSEW